MASMAAFPTRKVDRASPWHRMVPGEGWTIVLLHLVLVLIATWSVQAAGWSDHARLLPTVAVAAIAFGGGLAKSPAIDLLAHLLALWVGVIVVWIVTAVTFADLGTGWRGPLVAIAERARIGVQLSARGEPADDGVLFLGLLALSVWLVAYMSAWTLYRRQWTGASVGLPVVMVLINAGYSGALGPWPLVCMLFAAVMLTASHFHFRRRSQWAPEEVLGTRSLQWRSALIAAQIGLVALLGGWLAPEGARQQTIETLGARLEQPLDRIDDWGNGLFSRFGGNAGPRAKSYAQFSDSFELGGALDLGDDPTLVLDAESSSYLAAYRYDRWDGSGWESAVERTFTGRNAEGKRYSPQMRFAPNQPVALSDDVTTERAPVSGAITLIEADDNLLLTLETFQEAEVPTTVQLSWRTLDGARLPIDDPGVLPPDLRRLALLLEDANSAGYVPESEPALTGQAELDDTLLAEKTQLRDRLIAVEWAVARSGRVEALVVTGQLPIYDDVEAVFARDDPEGTTYNVTGLASLATADELRNAGQEYPAFIQDRYLQQSSTTTLRTRALAAAIVQGAGAANPFDQAVAIQNDLRQRIRYEEKIATPPTDQDLVDYVLFDSREGYCEYYASAMAVMLRTLGIPARIAVGYYPASFDDQYRGYLYRERNAHAWVEAYFPAYGWIPFEPTASQSVRQYGDNRLPDPLPVPSPSPALEMTPTPAIAPSETPQPIPPAATTDDASGGSNRELVIWALRGMLLIVALGGGLLGLVWFLWRKGLAGLSAPDALWARVLKAGRWMGIRAEPSMTPIEYASEIGRTVPSARVAASRAAALYTVRRYGMAKEPSDAGMERDAWQELRRPLTRAWARRRLLRRP